MQANVKPWYERNVYPNLTSVQRVLVVPGAYGSHVNHYPNGTYVCDNACYDKMCETDAHDFYTWGLADPMVVAIAPWDWGGCPTCNGSRWYVSLKILGVPWLGRCFCFVLFFCLGVPIFLYLVGVLIGMHWTRRGGRKCCATLVGRGWMPSFTTRAEIKRGCGCYQM